jgi:hypothetical protein
MNKKELQISLKYLIIDTPYGAISAKKKDLENISHLISMQKPFLSRFKLSNNTFTKNKLNKEDLIIIRDLMINQRSKIQNMIGSM